MLAFLDTIPVWLMALIVCGGSVVFISAVQLALHRLWPLDKRRPLNEVAGFIIAVVGVVYAVLLASIAILTIERYDRAEEVTQTEAGLVGDIYRDAVGLPQPQRTDFRIVLTDYLNTVVDKEFPRLQANDIEGVDWQVHGWNDLSRLLGELAVLNPANERESAFLQEVLGRINDLNDARRLRMFSATNSLDSVIWWVVIAGGLGTVAMSLLFGIHSARGHLIISNLLAFSISLVIVLIIAMDRPFTGQPRVTAEPFVYVQERLATL